MFTPALSCSDKQMASKDHLEDVKREVLVVGELIEILSGEPKYLQRKLRRHIKTVGNGGTGDVSGGNTEARLLCGGSIPCGITAQ